MTSTPQRQLRFVTNASPTSPLAYKRQRLNSASVSPLQSAATALFIPPPLPPSPYRFASDGTVVDARVIEPSTKKVPSGKRLLDQSTALLALDMDAHQITKAVRAKEQDDKETKKNYARHVKHYQEFWLTTTYAVGDPATGRAPIPAFPITVAKAVIFLQFESTRPQVGSISFASKCGLKRNTRLNESGRPQTLMMTFPNHPQLAFRV